MLYLKVDCSECNSKQELCIKTCETLTSISKILCSINGEHDFDSSNETNLSCVDDCMTSYFFIHYSCMIIFYNFAHVRPYLGNLTDNFISIFEDAYKKYPKNFLYEIYEDDNFKEPKTVTFEFIDLENKD